MKDTPNRVYHHHWMSPLRCLAASLICCQAACLEAPSEGRGGDGGGGGGGDGRIELVVRQGRVDLDLPDYPLLVSLGEDEELAAGASDDGEDIGFVGPDDVPLPHEIEEWDPDTGTLVAWVQIPLLLAGADTPFALVYGGEPIPREPDRLWQAYEGVWHLGGEEDSTGRGALVDSSDAVGAVAAAQVGGGWDLLGGSLVIGDPADGHLDYGGEDSFTMSMWLRRTGLTGSYQTFLSKGGGPDGDTGYALETDDSAETLYGCLSDVDEYDCAAPGEALVEGVWRLVALVGDREADAFMVYADGLVSSIHEEFSNLQPDENDNPRPLTVGANHLGQHPIIGSVDEVRVTRRALSPAWLAADAASQADPSFVERVPN
jgi:hypothetical protein